MDINAYVLQRLYGTGTPTLREENGKVKIFDSARDQAAALRLDRKRRQGIFGQVWDYLVPQNRFRMETISNKPGINIY
jgi:hypothetical protein